MTGRDLSADGILIQAFPLGSSPEALTEGGMRLPEAEEPRRAGPPLRTPFTDSRGPIPQNLRAEGRRHGCTLELPGDSACALARAPVYTGHSWGAGASVSVSDAPLWASVCSTAQWDSREDETSDCILLGVWVDCQSHPPLWCRDSGRDSGSVPPRSGAGGWEAAGRVRAYLLSTCYVPSAAGPRAHSIRATAPTVGHAS